MKCFHTVYQHVRQVAARSRVYTIMYIEIQNTSMSVVLNSIQNGFIIDVQILWYDSVKF